MLNHHPVLSLLGLALRGGRLVVGEEPVEGIVRARDARVLLLARDASDNTFRRCRHFADVGQCLWVTVPFTKDELGSAVGRSSVAIMAVTDVGLAHAIVQKLASEDPKRYGETAERLELKARRAAERGFSEETVMKLCDTLEAFENPSLEVLERAVEGLSVGNAQLIGSVKGEEVSDTLTMKRSKGVIRDMRIFENSLRRSLEMLRSAGCEAELETSDGDGETVYKIRVKR